MILDTDYTNICFFIIAILIQAFSLAKMTITRKDLQDLQEV